jgi:hypothetical protein
MIIWLASYPRSGNTFFRVLLKRIYGVSTYENYVWEQSADIERVREVIGLPDTQLSLEDMAKSDSCFFVKTHDLPHDDFPAIYFVRDGRDALVSHAHFILQYDLQIPSPERQLHFNDTLRMLIETDTSFGGWGNNVMAWTSRIALTVVIKFEDLIASPLECLRQATAQIGYLPPEIDSSQIPTFEELHQKVPQFFRKGQVGAWRDELPDDLHKLFWQRYGDAMRSMGYG